LKFVRERKNPVMAKDVAKQFAIAQSTAATHLRMLHAAGYITREQRPDGKIIWAKKTSVPVAVPEQDPVEQSDAVEVQPYRPTPADWQPPKPIWPDNPFKTSYPHVRGYDD
jgi:DNA-binding transcriptional MocR family regulator